MAHDERAYGYKPRGCGPGNSARDQTYPSEIAAQRPFAATRIRCDEPYNETDPIAAIRGDKGPGYEHMERPEEENEHGSVEESIALMNRRLRGGHGA